MIIYQTEILKEMIKEPTQLDIEKIMSQRNKHQTADDTYRLSRLEAGERGERIVLDYLEQYGADHWVVIKNMWLNIGGPFEGDIILITTSMVYIFEIKNYSSHFSYEDGITKINNNKISGNPINQARRNTINLEEICKAFSKDIEVKGALIFTGEDNYVEIDSDVKDIDIIQRNQLKHYIQQIAKDEEDYYKPTIDIKSFLYHLGTYEIERYFGPGSPKEEEISGLKKGIYCLHCKNYNVEINRKMIKCECGFSEDREIVILRMICEFGVLNFNQKLIFKGLEEFFGGDISRKSIQKVLRKYFKEIKNGKHSHYINKNLPLYKLFEEFDIQNKLHLSMNYTDYQQFMSDKS